MKDRRFNAAFRELRTIIGKPLNQFAKLLGCSYHTVKAVEYEANPVGEGLKNLVLSSTGAVLKPGGRVVPFFDVSGNDRPYTNDDYVQWVSSFNTDGAKLRYRNSCDWLQVLFEAALRPGFAGLRNRLPALCDSLGNWMDRAVKDFDLQKEINAILKERTNRVPKFRRYVADKKIGCPFFMTWSPHTSLNCGPNPEWDNIVRADPIKELAERYQLNNMLKIKGRSELVQTKRAAPSASGARLRDARKPSR